MIRGFSIGFAVALSSLAAGAEPLGEAGSPIGVEAAIGKSDGGHDLQFVVTNRSSTAILIPQRDMPWEEGAVVVAAEWDPERMWSGLESRVPSNHRASSPVSIAPGMSVGGGLSLEARVPGLQAALKSRHAVAFWFWEPRTPDRTSLGRHGGFVVIPRGGLHGGASASESAQGHDQPRDLQMGVEAALSSAGGKEAIEFSLLNTSRSPVEVARSNLPWLFPPSTIVMAVGLTPLKVLDTRYPLIGLPYGEVSLLPGAVESGALALDQRIRELDVVLPRSDMVVFWFYEGGATDGRRFGPQGGFVLVPKRGGQP